MSDRLLVLDLFSCSGIAAEGFQVCGAYVFGVDHKRPSFYPSDHLVYDVRQLTTGFIRQFDFVWSSPPCQRYSRLSGLQSTYNASDGDLVDFTRQLLLSSGVPSVIENVVQAPIAKDLILCGCMFGKDLIRRRAFEFVNWWPCFARPICKCNERNPKAITIAGNSGWSKQAAMSVYGIKRMRTRKELAEAVPPYYAAYVFELFSAHLLSRSNSSFGTLSKQTNSPNF